MLNKLTEKKFDVIIVGAGPAGGQCARELSRLNRKVLLIEKSKEIGQPNFSSGGIPLETLKDFDLPLDLAAGKWSKILIAAKNVSKTWDYGRTRGYVLDFCKFKRFLVQEAAENGAEILIGTSAEEPIVKNDSVVGVKYSGVFGKGEVFADIVVDASGPVGVLASKVGLRKQVPCSPTVGVELIVTNPPRELSETLAFYFGPEYVPRGYGWIFPMGANSAKIGVCVYNAAEYGVTNIMKVLENFIGKFPQLKDVGLMDLHGSSLYVTGGINKYSINGFLAIGDAAAQVNPLAGEGIRHALHSAGMAAGVINQALDKKDFSEKFLGRYDKEWKKYIGSKWKRSLFVSDKMYGNISNDRLYKFMKVLSKLSGEDLFELGFNYNFRKAARKDVVIAWFKKYKI